MDNFLQAAIDEAKKGMAEGGIPIGSVLVIDNKIVAEAIINGYKKEALYYMRKWIA